MLKNWVRDMAEVWCKLHYVVFLDIARENDGIYFMDAIGQCSFISFGEMAKE